MKLIIIDDEEQQRNFTTAVVKKHCPSIEIVAQAANVKEGVEAIQKYAPDLILLDIEMPDGTGFDLLKKLQVELKISDNGIGISQQFLPFVFDRFRQLDSSSTRTYGGLGLGLSIVRQLVESQGGTVRVESEGEGKGALFTVCFPVAPETDVVIPATSEVCPPQPSESINIFSENPTLEGLRVLVVDDDPDTLEMLDFALERFGAEVTTVDSVATALQTFNHGKFDVIVSDLGMPIEDGYSLIGKIRNSEQNRYIPAVAVSGYTRNEDSERALAAGFQNYLSKPVDISELASVILDLSRNHKL